MKNEAGGGDRLPHYTCSRLVVELQSKLDISRRLRSLYDTGSAGLHGGIGNRQVDAVECIQKVAAELQLEAFGQMEVFLQAEVPIVETGAAQTAELRRARSESCRVGIVVGIKPLETATLRCCCL